MRGGDIDYGSRHGRHRNIADDVHLLMDQKLLDREERGDYLESTDHPVVTAAATIGWDHTESPQIARARGRQVRQGREVIEVGRSNYRYSEYLLIPHPQPLIERPPSGWALRQCMSSSPISV